MSYYILIIAGDFVTDSTCLFVDIGWRKPLKALRNRVSSNVNCGSLDNVYSLFAVSKLVTGYVLLIYVSGMC
jgi:hypothetical protein